MIKDKCKHCKYCQHGLDVDYVPSYWCKLNNFNNADNCEHDKEEYTIKEYIEDILPGICILIGIGLFTFIMSLK